MENVDEYIGQQIKARRKSAKIPVGLLGKALGLTSSTISNIEAGRHRVKSTTIFMVCRILKCQPNDLFPFVDPFEVVIDKKHVEVTKVKQVKQLILTDKTTTHNNQSNE